MLRKLTILFIACSLLLITGCVSPYRYFPEEPKWKSNDLVITSIVDGYVVTDELIYNYVYQKLYLYNIQEWRKHNGVK